MPKTKVRIKVNGKNYVHCAFFIASLYPDGSPKDITRINDPRQVDPNKKNDYITGYLQHQGNW